MDEMRIYRIIVEKEKNFFLLYLTTKMLYNNFEKFEVKIVK